MDLKKYKELTGATVKTSDEARITATIRRTKATLETMLGFTIKPKNLYTEKGKTRYEGAYPIKDFSNLLDPDEEQGIYKLFRYSDKDKYLHVDPFKNVYAVKLVMPINDGEFVTVATLDNVSPEYMQGGIGKFIERYEEWFSWQWYKTWQLSWKGTYDGGLQLAVDADWIDCLPDDIMYLWADMVTYYADPNHNIKSESVDGHSWSKGDYIAPELKSTNKLLLSRYAGPYGSVNRNPVSSL